MGERPGALPARLAALCWVGLRRSREAPVRGGRLRYSLLEPRLKATPGSCPSSSGCSPFRAGPPSCSPHAAPAGRLCAWRPASLGAYLPEELTVPFIPRAVKLGRASHTARAWENSDVETSLEGEKAWLGLCCVLGVKWCIAAAASSVRV